ncbi:MAG: transcriptional regulator [Thaumarchaeota archaeon]|nr:transcriptional regulator [Nitrososphaerota archaeon]
MSDSAEKPNKPASSPADSIQSLSEQLSNSTLKSSSRILILILLAMNKKATAAELRALTGLARGSLQNHLEKLESSGYVRTKNVRSFGGWRQTVEITEKGLDNCRALLQKIQSLDV